MFTAMKIRTLGYFAKQGFISMKRNRIMSLASITIVAASLFIFGVFMLIVLNVNQLMANVEKGIEIKAIMNKDITSISENRIEKEIKEISGVREVRYESKEQALEKFKKQLGEKKYLANGLELDNPLPASFIIKVNKASDVLSVSRSVKAIDGIEQVMDGQQMVNKIVRVSGFIKVLSLVLMIILGVISISLIANTIKLTVFARKREIGIMKYIGATDWFIRWPFIFEGMLLGLFGSLGAILLLYGGYLYAAKVVATSDFIFTLLPAGQIMPFLMKDFVGIGVLLGGFGSVISIRKFLAV